MNLRHRHERIIADICTPAQGCRYPQSLLAPERASRGGLPGWEGVAGAL